MQTRFPFVFAANLDFLFTEKPFADRFAAAKATLAGLGYCGAVGCEYHPRAGTRQGLGWLDRWRPERKP